METLKAKVFVVKGYKYHYKSAIISSRGPGGYAGIEVEISPCKNQNPQVTCIVPAPKQFQDSAIESIQKFLSSENVQFFCDVLIKDILWDERETTYHCVAHASRETLKSALRCSELYIHPNEVTEVKIVVDELLARIGLVDSPEKELYYKHLDLRKKGIINDDLSYDKEAYAEYISQKYQKTTSANAREEKELAPSEVEKKWQISSPISPRRQLNSGVEFFEVLVILAAIIIPCAIVAELVKLILE